MGGLLVRGSLSAGRVVVQPPGARRWLCSESGLWVGVLVHKTKILDELCTPEITAQECTRTKKGGVQQAQAKQDSKQGQTTKASHISTRTHIHISGCTHLHTHLRGCMYVYLQVTTCKYTYIHACKYMHVCA